MKQVGQNYKTGDLALLDVAVPSCRPGTIIVRTTYSLISTGTEKTKVEESKLSLFGKARARPDQVRKVLDSVSQYGLSSTVNKTRNQLDSYTPLGYSLTGTVEELGHGVDGFSIGQRVACAGNEHAFHAEFNRIPKNLCIPVPDAVDGVHAAFTTVGAIAVQAYRRAEAQLGETAVVIGLGLVGQLLSQILRVAGIDVVGVDLSPERCALAESLGAVAAAPSDSEGLAKVRAALSKGSRGFGADHVFLAASTASRQPVELAAEFARDRARIIDIGRCNLDLLWNEYYEKELDVRFSRSYGPGRYDPVYEIQGIDYPIGYVRWTEERNMRAFVDLLSKGAIDLDPLVSEIIPFEQAVETYERLHAGKLRGIGTVFKYANDTPLNRIHPSDLIIKPSLHSPDESTIAPSIVRLGVIGAGNYAATMLLPHLARRTDVLLSSVSTATALSGENARRRFGFLTTTTDYRTILGDDSIAAVLIATRHDSHAQLVAEALRAGKAVFVEKPLAVAAEELQMITDAIHETGNRRLMVGFNRRFAPLLTHLRRRWGSEPEPMMIQYTVNAGRLDPGSWYSDTARHGSRFVGEGGHFIDTVSWWLGHEPMEVFALGGSNDPDNLVATLRYPDGSVATIAYLTGGSRRYAKETMIVTGGGAVGRLENFRRVDLWRGRRHEKKRVRRIDKGQQGELDAFVEATKGGATMPISVHSLLATTAATFAVQRSLLTGAVEPVPAVFPMDLDGV